MNILIAVDYDRKVIKFAESNNIYYSRRNLIQRDKFDSHNIYQTIASEASVRIMFSLIAPYRARRNDKDYGKEYKLGSYRVRTYCKVLNCKIPYWDVGKEEYDLLTCKVCGELFQAIYDSVNNIYRLNEIILNESYCSDECLRFKQNECVMCGKKINSVYLACSAKCELAYKLQKKSNEDTIKQEAKRAWEI